MDIGFLSGFLYGILGGFFNEIVGLYKIRRSRQLPEWLRLRRYWIITLLMVLAGGFLVCAYLGSAMKLTPILAINIGASAPLIIGRIADESLPSEPSPRID
jgi:fructose-specific phosphotransferase system IIC component